MQSFGDRRRPNEPELIPLEVPVPPEVARTFGYRGDARFVGFYWEPAGDEVVYDDGRLSGTGSSYAFLRYRRHPAVEPLLEEYNLGHSDLKATHCLILDRQTGRASVAGRADAYAFLRAQHPAAPELSPQRSGEVRKLIEGLARGWQEFEIDREAIRAAMAEEHRAVSQMVAHLDRFRLPG